MLAAATGHRTCGHSCCPPRRAATGAARASRITQGTTLVHADLHNHTVLSDGDGDPALAFASMRAAGLDVAALTDHTTLFAIEGLSGREWDRAGALADAADDPGNYTAIRGFEWSHPLLGHVNVWFTPAFTDLGGSSSMSRLYSWITGSGGVAGFNHPGREIVRFNNFPFNAARARADGQHGDLQPRRRLPLRRLGQRPDLAAERRASTPAGAPGSPASPTSTAPTGVSRRARDAPASGSPRTPGRRCRPRCGPAVFFATRVSGLRLDATANGVRMGGELPVAGGDVRFRVDLDRGPEWVGKPLRIQVLRPGHERAVGAAGGRHGRRAGHRRSRCR